MPSSTSSSEARPRGPFALLRRAAAFGAFVLAALVLVALVGEPGTRVDYFGAMAAKHRRLAALGSPKAVLIGGSNVALGLDSRLLEEALCKPVVNLSMHASLGFNFMVEEVAERLGPGDVVIAAPEQGLYARRDVIDDVLYQAADRYPAALRSMPWHHRPKVVAGVLAMRLRSSYRAWLGLAWPVNEPMYRADGFDARGDLVGHLAAPPATAPEIKPLRLSERLPSRAFLRAAGRLEAAARRAGATVIYTWPVIAEGARNAALDSAIAELMRRRGHPLLGEPTAFQLPDTAFLDTQYHPKAWGRGERTRRLIALLCRAGLCCDRRRPDAGD